LRHPPNPPRGWQAQSLQPEVDLDAPRPGACPVVARRIAARSVVLRRVVARGRASAGVLSPAAPRHVLLHSAFPKEGGRREERYGQRQFGVDCLLHGFDVHVRSPILP